MKKFDETIKSIFLYDFQGVTQPEFTCSKLRLETLEQCVKNVQSLQ